MFRALKSGFRSLATLKRVMNVAGELQTEKNSCGIARFPCDTTVLLFAFVFTNKNLCLAMSSIMKFVTSLYLLTLNNAVIEVTKQFVTAIDLKFGVSCNPAC